MPLCATVCHLVAHRCTGFAPWRVPSSLFLLINLASQPCPPPIRFTLSRCDSVTFAHQVTVRSLSLNGLRPWWRLGPPRLGLLVICWRSRQGHPVRRIAPHIRPHPAAVSCECRWLPKSICVPPGFAEKQHACSISWCCFERFPFHYMALVSVVVIRPMRIGLGGYQAFLPDKTELGVMIRCVHGRCVRKSLRLPLRRLCSPLVRLHRQHPFPPFLQVRRGHTG